MESEQKNNGKKKTGSEEKRRGSREDRLGNESEYDRERTFGKRYDMMTDNDLIA